MLRGVETLLTEDNLSIVSAVRNLFQRCVDCGKIKLTSRLDEGFCNKCVENHERDMAHTCSECYEMFDSISQLNLHHEDHIFNQEEMELEDYYQDEFDRNFCDGKWKHFENLSGSVDQCPECDHWNATIYDADIEGFNPPDLRIFCRCCGFHEVYE